jgi:hypothetical protein
MKTERHPPAAAGDRDREVDAAERLALNRAHLAHWLEQDRADRNVPASGGWAARAVMPLIDGLRQHPTASMALGALAQTWLSPSPRDGVLAPEALALGAALAAVRKHPRTSLALAALAGAGWWWVRYRQRPVPPP